MSKDRPIAVQFFRLDSGREPVREWLKALPPEHRKTIGEDIKTLQYGWPVGMPLARKMEVRALGAPVSHFCRDRSDDLHYIGWQDRSATRVCEEVSENTEQRVNYCETLFRKIEVVTMAKKNVGSSFDKFLEEEEILEEASAVAVKRLIAFQLAEKMSEKNLNKSELARRMKTSRSALDRLLDPDNASVTLQTLQSAVRALGGRLNVELKFDRKAAKVA